MMNYCPHWFSRLGLVEDLFVVVVVFALSFPLSTAIIATTESMLMASWAVASVQGLCSSVAGCLLVCYHVAMLLAATRHARSRSPPRPQVDVLPAINFGDHVRVLHNFSHAVGYHYDIEAGMSGVVTQVDSAGDVLIQFANLSLRKWIIGDEKALLEVIYASNLTSSVNECRPKPKTRATPHAYENPTQVQAQPLQRPKWNVLDFRPLQNGKPMNSAAPARVAVPNTVATPARSVAFGGGGPNLAAVLIADPDALSSAVKDTAAQIRDIPGTANTSLSLTFLLSSMATIAAFHARFMDMGIHIDEMTRAGVPTAPKQVPWAALAGDSFQPCLLVTFSAAPKEQKISFQCRLKRSIVTAKGKRAALSANLELMVAFLGKPSGVAASNPAVARDGSAAPRSIIDMLRQSQHEARDAPGH